MKAQPKRASCMLTKLVGMQEAADQLALALFTRGKGFGSDELSRVQGLYGWP